MTDEIKTDNVGGYCVIQDPMSDLQCESCQ